MKRYTIFAVIAFFGLMMFGCSTNQKMLKGAHQNGTASNMSAKVSTQSIQEPSVNSVGEQNIRVNENLSIEEETKNIKKDIHFNFNSAKIEDINSYGLSESPSLLLNNIAKFMMKHPDVNVRIEGNCDERGTEEYNLALGLKRAKAAKQYLISKGISQDRIDIISYGEDKPLVSEHNEYAWAKNRRDHFSVLTK